MRAFHLSKLTPLDELELSEVPAPQPGPGEVLIRLKAAALNHRDLRMFSAEPRPPFVLGSDGAGVVAALGDGVTGWAPGAEVVVNPSLHWGEREDAYGPDWSILGWPHDGTLANYLLIPAENVFPKPDHLTWAEAAALPLAGLTAYRALFARARLEAGERVLIHGIGGGVALCALQLARAAGAQVMVTSTSDAKLARARALGADLGLNSRTADWEQAARDWSGGAGVDVVVESIGGEFVSRSLPALRRGGRLVTFGRTAQETASLDVRLVFWNQLSILGTTMGSPRDFAALLRFVTEHRISPVVDSVRPLAEGREAFRRLARGEQFGKLVLTCD